MCHTLRHYASVNEYWMMKLSLLVIAEDDGILSTALKLHGMPPILLIDIGNLMLDIFRYLIITATAYQCVGKQYITIYAR